MKGSRCRIHGPFLFQIKEVKKCITYTGIISLEEIHMAEEPIYFLSGFDSIKTLPKATNAILSNAPAILKSKIIISNPKHYNNTPPPQYFMTDSGGKQIFNITSGNKAGRLFKGLMFDPEKPVNYQGYFNWTPEHWKVAILKDTPDAAITMDYPILFGKKISNYDELYAKAKLINLNWTKQCLCIQKKYFPQTTIFVPFQGYSLEHLYEFVDSISAYDYDGICLPMRCFRNNVRLINFLVNLKNIGIKKIHLLGTSRLDVIATMNYLSYHNYFQFISYDSCTVAITARSGKVLIPFDLRGIHISETEMINDLINNGVYEREFSTGHTLRDLQIMDKKENRKWLTEINYDALIKTKRELFKHSKSIDSLLYYFKIHSCRLDVIESVLHSLQILESN